MTYLWNDTPGMLSSSFLKIIKKNNSKSYFRVIFKKTTNMAFKLNI